MTIKEAYETKLKAEAMTEKADDAIVKFNEMTIANFADALACGSSQSIDKLTSIAYSMSELMASVQYMHKDDANYLFVRLSDAIANAKIK